jgi:AcrR family transcriptional regulator
VALVARDGYAELTVERLQLRAGVSRASFYQYFTNLEDCFSSAYREHAERLTRELDAAADASEDRELAVLRALVDAALARPDVARLLMLEGLAAGAAGLRERDVLIARIALAMTGAAGRVRKIDLPAAVLIGAVFRFIAIRLAQAGVADTLREEVCDWATAFARRPSQRRWGERLAPALPDEAQRALAAPKRARRARAGDSARQRVLHATAALIFEKGYTGLTVVDIVAAAGVSRRSFYNEFTGKVDAFEAAYEYGFEQVMAACAPAFFAPGTWPERVWQAAQAFTRFMASEPLIAHLGFVECHAIGPRFEPRVHDTQLAFTLFLEEGYRQRLEGRSLSRACSALTAAAVLEAGFRASRYGASLYVRSMQPLAVYIALTPFVGADEAGGFVAEKLAARACPTLVQAISPSR